MFLAALIMSYVTVGAACYSYAQMLCEIEHNGASAPVNIIFLTALLPYAGMTFS